MTDYRWRMADTLAELIIGYGSALIGILMLTGVIQ